MPPTDNWNTSTKGAVAFRESGRLESVGFLSISNNLHVFVLKIIHTHYFCVKGCLHDNYTNLCIQQVKSNSQSHMYFVKESHTQSKKKRLRCTCPVAK